MSLRVKDDKRFDLGFQTTSFHIFKNKKVKKLSKRHSFDKIMSFHIFKNIKILNKNIK